MSAATAALQPSVVWSWRRRPGLHWDTGATLTDSQPANEESPLDNTPPPSLSLLCWMAAWINTKVGKRQQLHTSLHSRAKTMTVSRLTKVTFFYLLVQTCVKEEKTLHT